MKKKVSKKDDGFPRTQTFEITLPLAFWHICKLLNIEPRKIIFDLFVNIGGRVRISNGLIYQNATDYFIGQKYGQENYTENEIRQMIGEVGVITGLCPPTSEAETKELEEYAAMRDEYFKSWAKKWGSKCKRKPLL